jgi:LmbE family N-acetylglucosaminyl deacetylase
LHIPQDDVLWFAPPPEIRRTPPRGRVLCLAPHPDDECIGPGGSLALHRAQGDAVRVVIGTDGQAGDPAGKFQGHDYAARRRAESVAAGRELGVDDLVFWGFPDSCVITDNDIETIAQRIEGEIAGYRPDVVYGPWEGEGNDDHRALYCGMVRAVRRMRFGGEVLAYEIWNFMVPDVIHDVSAVIDQKERAIRCFETQMSYTDILRTTLGLNAARSIIFNQGVGYGEALRRVRVG